MFNSYFKLNFAPDIQGEIAALSAACLWAVASILYGRLGERIRPLQLNLMKGIVACVLLSLTIFINQELFPAITPIPFCLLLLSGIVGIGLGDIAFLAAINSLGARRVLLMGTLAPPMTAVGAMIFLHEDLNLSAWFGISLTIGGVAWVITERESSNDELSEDIGQGIVFGLLSAIANAAGAVLSRAAFASGSIPPLWASLLRLIAAVLILLPWTWLAGRRNQTIFPFWQSSQIMGTIFIAAFCGTYLGIWLQQTAIKFTAVGIASTLLQTSPVFILPLSIWMGEKVTLTSVLGVVMAIAGVGVLFYFN